MLTWEDRADKIAFGEKVYVRDLAIARREYRWIQAATHLRAVAERAAEIAKDYAPMDPTGCLCPIDIATAIRREFGLGKEENGE